MMMPIYLDYAATTPIDPRVAEKMLPYLTEMTLSGNPASMTHSYGHMARQAIEAAREEVAALIAAEPNEIIWTSGATESINLALKGAAQLYQRKGKHIVTIKTEHKAVLDTCQQLEKEGFQVSYLTPESNGLIDIEKFKSILSPETIIVTIMHVNNEIGIIQNIDAIAKITAEHEILLHVDAAQSNGKIFLDVNKTPLDLISLSSHKIYGPKGVGALYVRRKPRVRVAAQIHGGGQEQGMRSGTLATHQIVGMAAAFGIAKSEMKKDYQKIQGLRKRFLQKLSILENMSINGDPAFSYPGILNICFGNNTADTLMQKLSELAISSGSACGSKGIEPSYVLRALGLSAEQAKTALRFSFGRFTKEEEIDFAAERIVSLCQIQPG